MSYSIKIILVVLALAGALYGVSRVGNLDGDHEHECAPASG